MKPATAAKALPKPVKPAKAARGRPADPAKDEVIKAVAGSLFMEQGVQATTMDQIARQAGVSKLTLYRKYPDKNALFVGVMGCKCDEYMPESLFEQAQTGNAEQALTCVGTALLELCTHEEGVNLMRIMTAEAKHNPGLGEQFFKSGSKKLKGGVRSLMAALAKQKALNIDNPDEAAGFFVALIMGSELQKHATLGIGPRPSGADIDSYVKRAVAFFMRAYR